MRIEPPLVNGQGCPRADKAALDEDRNTHSTGALEQYHHSKSNEGPDDDDILCRVSR